MDLKNFSVVSYVIPTLNEVKNVPLVLQLIEDAHQMYAHAYEVVFVDDKSTDGTTALIEDIAQKNPKVRLVHSPQLKGLGHALKLGLKACKGDRALFLDCDVSIRKEDLVKVLKASGPQKMLIGSRYIHGGRTIGAPVVKVFMSKCLNWLISRYLSIPAIDISHSLRIFPIAPILSHLPENDTHPAFFWELSLTGLHQGLEVCEVPITFRERIYGQSKNVMKKMIKSVLKGLKTVKQLKTQSTSSTPSA